MRVKKKIEDIDYQKTTKFFEQRAKIYKDSNPYAVTMYQDNDSKLVEQRNRKEIEILYPLLKIDKNSRILDLACGIGRWADAVGEEIVEYCGVDFSNSLIEIAQRRNCRPEMSFLTGSVIEIDNILSQSGKKCFNRILLIGILMYINDADVLDTLRQIERHCEEHTIICIREPIGIIERLTLKDFYSEDLKDNYNAIYRTGAELKEMLQDSLLSKGFCIVKEDFLFRESGLNNRKETAQYYYILER